MVGARYLAFGLVTLVGTGCSRPDRAMEFNYDVRPVLADHCYECHGFDPESREANLRLDTHDGLFAPLRDDSSRHVVVPGSPGASELVRRITSSDPSYRMPPGPHALSRAQITALTEWVAQGAQWKPHWSHMPPLRSEVPRVRRSQQVANPIDNFVLARLQAEGLRFSPQADRRTLIRRLYLDLLGLPPSVETVRAYVNDDEPDAYERLVDRVLTSSHFGERMAQHWLDLARYADTNGYSIDGGRHMWVWRDWVIHAFNSNMPYDQFAIEQIAGDLLEDATDWQRVATGFNRNHMITHEGGTIPEENLVNYVADRVKTTSEVFLGLTYACAQCHDHKYDPITQKDYYRLFAFFNHVPERGLDGDAGINAVPFVEARTPLATDDEIASVRTRLKELSAYQQDDHAEQSNWEIRERAQLDARGDRLQFRALHAVKVTTPNSGYTGEPQPDGSVRIRQPGWLAAYNVALEDAEAAPTTGLRVVFLPHDASGALGHGQGERPGAFVLTSVHVQAGDQAVDQVDFHRTVPITRVTASAAHSEYPAAEILDDRRRSGWSPPDATGQPAHITVTFAEPVEAAHYTVNLSFGQGSSQVAGHFQIQAMQGTDDGTDVAPALEAALYTPAIDRTRMQRGLLRAAFHERAAETASMRHAIANLEERLRVLTEPYATMTMAVADSIRPTHVLYRGQYDQALEAVDAGMPDWLPPFPSNSGRLELARWLFEPEHPLTARVAVNRFWQMLFGQGLVRTPADFGARGALPSHPELLDWLSVTFMESGYDVKALLKTIVMSRTYRQTSHADPELHARDPDNQLLARGPRFRLQAEFIRDQALAVSGLLVRRLGGPSVRPYQPPGLWKEVSHYGSTPATAQTYVQDRGEKLFRRSLYTYWKRTAPPPAMMVFDAPTREVCTIQRENTNTPLQALVLLNDPQFVEASRALAARVLSQAADSDLLGYAYEAVTGQELDDWTRSRLEARLDEEVRTFEADPEGALALLRVGESERSGHLDPVTHAAWTVVASLLFNLSETITRA